MPDLTPNVGMWWYFFTEMFDHFRPFFLGVFQVSTRSGMAEADAQPHLRRASLPANERSALGCTGSRWNHFNVEELSNPERCCGLGGAAWLLP